MIEEEEEKQLPIVGVVQFAPKFKDIEANIETISHFIRESKADILIFPELALCGYAFSSNEDALPYSIESDSPEIDAIAAVARETSTAVVFGFCERAGEELFNSCVAISSHGDVAGFYRKVHLFYNEKMVFYHGDLGYPVFEVALREGRTVNLGMQICYDWRFAEVSLQLATAGAELIVIPANIVTTTGMLLDTLKVRAFEHKVIIAFADRIGTEQLTIEDTEETTASEETLEFRGESVIINYNGTVLASLSTTESSVAYAACDFEATRSKRINAYNDLSLDRKIVEREYAALAEDEEDEEE